MLRWRTGTRCWIVFARKTTTEVAAISDVTIHFSKDSIEPFHVNSPGEFTGV